MYAEQPLQAVANAMYALRQAENWGGSGRRLTAAARHSRVPVGSHVHSSAALPASTWGSFSKSRSAQCCAEKATSHLPEGLRP